MSRACPVPLKTDRFSQVDGSVGSARVDIDGAGAALGGPSGRRRRKRGRRDVQGPAGWCRASPTSALVVDEDATE